MKITTINAYALKRMPLLPNGLAIPEWLARATHGGRVSGAPCWNYEDGLRGANTARQIRDFEGVWVNSNEG